MSTLQSGPVTRQTIPAIRRSDGTFAASWSGILVVVQM
jgi:hypothetical protein